MKPSTIFYLTRRYLPPTTNSLLDVDDAVAILKVLATTSACVLSKCGSLSVIFLQILTTNISMKVVCAEFDQKILYRAQPKNHFQHAGSLVQASLFVLFLPFCCSLQGTPSGPYRTREFLTILHPPEKCLPICH